MERQPNSTTEETLACRRESASESNFAMFRPRAWAQWHVWPGARVCNNTRPWASTHGIWGHGWKPCPHPHCCEWAKTDSGNIMDKLEGVIPFESPVSSTQPRFSCVSRVPYVSRVPTQPSSSLPQSNPADSSTIPLLVPVSPLLIHSWPHAVRWIHHGPSSPQLCLVLRILHLQPPSPGLDLCPPTHRLRFGSKLPQLHHGHHPTSSTRLSPSLAW